MTDIQNKAVDNQPEVETEEDGIRAGALRIAKYRFQAQQMRQRLAAQTVSLEQQQSRD
jgi:hypothetical protein